MLTITFDFLIGTSGGKQAKRFLKGFVFSIEPKGMFSPFVQIQANGLLSYTPRQYRQASYKKNPLYTLFSTNKSSAYEWGHNNCFTLVLYLQNAKNCIIGDFYFFFDPGFEKNQGPETVTRNGEKNPKKGQVGGLEKTMA